MTEQKFKNHQEAGWKLAETLADYRCNNNLILALPRSGVVVADEIAKR
jgi:predicted phosphoribosyltransferase